MIKPIEPIHPIKNNRDPLRDRKKPAKIKSKSVKEKSFSEILKNSIDIKASQRLD